MPATIQEQTTDNQNTIIENEAVVELIDNQVSEDSKEEKADFKQMFLDIKEKFGKNAIVKGMNLQQGATTMERNRQIGGHKSGV